MGKWESPPDKVWWPPVLLFFNNRLLVKVDCQVID